MNYPESELILREIKKAKKILVNCHHRPDADSVGSAIALGLTLAGKLKKKITIVCPDELPTNLKFIALNLKIETVDFEPFDFSKFDLFMTLDSSSWNRVTGKHNLPKPNIPIIVIDHHKTNQKFGKINLIVDQMGATCELLYYLFQDFGLPVDGVEEIDGNIANALLAGIIGDTGCFRFPEASWRTIGLGKKLMQIGGDKDKAVFNLYQSYQLSHVKLWIELMKNLKIDRKGRFVWSAVTYGVFKNHGEVVNAKSELADILFQSIDGTDYGWVAVEEKDCLSVSFRSRTGFDVSKIASELGGGGHRWASAARIQRLPFDQAIQKILAVCQNSTRKH